MMQNILLLILAVLSLGSLAFYGRLVVGLGRLPLDRISTSLYKGGDVFFVSLLVLYNLLNIWSQVTTTKKLVVTFDILLSAGVMSFLLVVSILCFLSLRGISPIKVFGLHWKTWRTGLPVVLGALVAIYPILTITFMVSSHFLGTTPQDIVIFLQKHATLRDRLAIIFFAVILAPLTEELVFRGYLHGVIRKYGGPWCAIVITAMFFSAIHVHPPVLAPLFLLGLALSLVYEFTGSLWAPMLMHGSFNAITIIVGLCWPDLLL